MKKGQIALLVFAILFALISIVALAYECVFSLPAFDIKNQEPAAALALIVLLPLVIIATPISAIFGFASAACFFPVAKRSGKATKSGRIETVGPTEADGGQDGVGNGNRNKRRAFSILGWIMIGVAVLAIVYCAFLFIFLKYS